MENAKKLSLKATFDLEEFINIDEMINPKQYMLNLIKEHTKENANYYIDEIMSDIEYDEQLSKSFPDKESLRDTLNNHFTKFFDYPADKHLSIEYILEESAFGTREEIEVSINATFNLDRLKMYVDKQYACINNYEDTKTANATQKDTIKVTGISWETGGKTLQECGLPYSIDVPASIIAKAENIEDAKSIISDTLSGRYGYIVDQIHVDEDKVEQILDDTLNKNEDVDLPF